jgi:hypothetical protein
LVAFFTLRAADFIAVLALLRAAVARRATFFVAVRARLAAFGVAFRAGTFFFFAMTGPFGPLIFGRFLWGEMLIRI